MRSVLASTVLLAHGLLLLALWQAQAVASGQGGPRQAAQPLAALAAPILHVRLLQATPAPEPRRRAPSDTLEATPTPAPLPAPRTILPHQPTEPAAPHAPDRPQPPDLLAVAGTTPADALPATGLASGTATRATAAPAQLPVAGDAPAQNSAAPAPNAAAVRVMPLAASPAPAPLRLAQADHQHCPPAAYPALLRERGIEGAVVLRVRVDLQGQPADVQLVAGSGYRLFDEAALRQVRGCRFIPAARGDDFVESWVEFPVRFALNAG